MIPLKLILERKIFTEKSTIGDLVIDAEFICFILEDCVRGEKLPGITAIPAGRYEIVINYSERFKRRLPLLLNVPNFEGIRIHPGNIPENTDGCLLPGTEVGQDYVAHSREAFNKLFNIIDKAMFHGKVFIEIWENRNSERTETIT